MILRSMMILSFLVQFSSLSFAQDRYIPNDPLFTYQWWGENTGQQLVIPKIMGALGYMVPFEAKPDIDVDLPEAWAIERGSDDCLVAVLDVGFQLDHPDLYRQFWQNSDEIPRNGIDDDNNGLVDDVNGWNFIRNDQVINIDFKHGTEIAGIIAAEMDNNIGIAGIAPGCKILPVVAGDISHSVGIDNLVPQFKALAAGIRYAIQMKASVISISLIIPSIDTRLQNFQSNFPDAYSAMSIEGRFNLLLDLLAQELEAKNATHTAIKEAYKVNIPIVAAAGNTGRDEMTFPTAFKEVISVASIRSNGELSGFTTKGEWIDVSAPGENILTCSDAGRCPGNFDCSITGNCHNHADYNHPDGTSFSAPIVAGVVALLRSKYPTLTIEEIRETLKRTGKPITSDPTLPPLVSAGNALKNPFRFGSEVLLVGK
ncbi:MAG: hypothetical protein A3F16_01140 [Deltaproteobacteria bacterium RIFCSPHIGHO2_12_FULL_43_9]|nr:MAG: hypothetical protein A3F16_01140 [Deltaproteobacteria bacterium RIFCSPHIGHO2_12_FULL_43_9]